MKKLLFAINPHAGKGEIKTKALEVIDLFVHDGYEVTVHTTQRRREITHLLAGRAALYDLIVCCGGDGTLNETIDGLMRCAQRPPLGYIPAGTVNDFASSLGISKNILQAAHTILQGVPFACDIGSFGARYFSYIAAFGAFTDVAYQTPQQSKNMLGRAAYFLEGIRRLPSIHPYHMKLTHDSGEIEGDFLFGMVSNALSVGGFKLRSPEIRMNDGLLELLLVRDPKNAAEATAIIGAVLGRDFSSPYITTLRTKQLSISAAEAVPWTLDGEFGGKVETVQIENHHAAITVLTNPPPPAP